MTNITETSTFATNVRRYDTSDPVLGGLSGESNDPIIALTNRTRYLLDRLNFLDVVAVAVNTTIDNTYKYKLIKALTGANIVLQLDDIANFTKGDVLTIKAQTTAIKTISVVPFAGQSFFDGNSSLGVVYLCDGEVLQIVANTGGWELLIKPANIYLAGDDTLVRKLPKNAVVADGCTSLASLPLRADYARLWDAVSASGLVVSEILWFSDPLRYKAFFSSGNGSTTFRWPDLRGMHMRALDLSRGIDTGRLDNSVGGYEGDEIKSHTHNITEVGDNRLDAVHTFRVPSSNSDLVEVNDFKLQATGGPENRVKTIGKIPVIYY